MHLLSSTILSGGSIIDLDGTIFIQTVLFFLCFGVLHFLVFKPMVALFEARELAIDGARAEAHKLQAEATQAGTKFDDELARVRVQASEERDRLRNEGQKLERSVLEAVKKETDAQTAAAAAKLEDESVKLRSELRATVPVLSRQIASKLLQREVA